MPYIKISDPNIIDLAAWHQVINVVNQHSDSITAISNNFGAQGTGYTNWNSGQNISQQYDPGSTKIVFGKYKVDTASGGASVMPSNKHMYYVEIPFANQSTAVKSFDETPIVTATAQFGSTTVNTNNTNVIVTVQAVTNEKFVARVVDSRSFETGGTVRPLTSSFFINWMAIGPK